MLPGPHRLPVMNSLGAHLKSQALGVALLSGILLTGPGSWGGTSAVEIQAATRHDQRGMQLLQSGDVAGAEREFRAALSNNPDSAEVHTHLGMVLLKTGSPEAAILELQTAVRLQPRNPTAHFWLGTALRRVQNFRGATREYRKTLELRPNDADAYFSYSRFLASRHRLDEAIAHLGRAVELDPLSRPLQANRALLDYFAGRYDEAGSRLREIGRASCRERV